MKKKLLSRVSPEKFPVMFSEIVKLREFMIELGIERSWHHSKMSGTLVQDNRLETKTEKTLKKLEDVKIDLPALINFRDSYPEGHEKRTDLEHQIYETKREIVDLEEKVEKEKSIDFVKDVAKFTSYEEHIEAFDALADEIGAWFATGVLGKGSVEYNGKTYTAE